MGINDQSAREHLKDSADCLSEAIKNLRRVYKHYPATREKLQDSESKLSTIRKELQSIDIPNQEDVSLK